MIELLFGSWMGVLTIIVILFMLVMMGYLGWVFIKKSGE
ncbi:MAG: DUF3149 domain-containing protein [Candidatus Thiothrix putei]|jgi:Protein of unknown function (DUF3149).|uniref:DUF3149 domain-containing protein n=1 Tax=Candidatus Thiothrix putei TaxID=3080811 RepID=A0AA95KJQ6_9GAMM|nr:DUF3149 domain-containing protein [Thiothrix caldifontis]WGZ95639.1 MAG: DUF3149 domain-containing protein [Candidatus Thiothrix putei]